MVVNKVVIFITAIIIIIVSLIVVIFLSSLKKPLPTIPSLISPTPFPLPTNLYPKKVLEIPSLPPEKGVGVDTQAKSVKDSEAEINKIYSFLPYQNNLTLTTGVKVEILIPSKEFQDIPWVLRASINGIVYNAADPSNPDYTLMKNSFREASSIVLSFLKEKGVDTSKVYISWGDREFIQTASERWLKD